MKKTRMLPALACAITILASCSAQQKSVQQVQREQVKQIAMGLKNRKMMAFVRPPNLNARVFVGAKKALSRKVSVADVESDTLVFWENFTEISGSTRMAVYTSANKQVKVYSFNWHSQELDEETGGDRRIARVSARVANGTMDDYVDRLNSRPATPTTVSIITIAIKRGNTYELKYYTIEPRYIPGKTERAVRVPGSPDD
jgi:hypothetical protein